MSTTPQWPAVIKHHEHHELVLVDSEQEWFGDAQLSRFPYANEDRLIDSQGQLFQPVYESPSQQVRLCSLQQHISLDSFSLLLRKHLCVENACCISKVSVSSYAQGFNLLMSAIDN